METLEKSRMCRLCGKQSGISIDIFDKNENHVRKINAILPILVHEMDLLPKQMCHRCSYKLEEFYNFYVECAKTDTELKSQLSWMRKENLEEKIVTPMVKMNRFKIKTEMPDNDSIDPNSVLGHISESSLIFPASILHNNFDPNASSMLSCSRCRCLCNRSIKINKKSPKQVKTTSKTESGNQAHSSNNLNKIGESEKPGSGDKDITFNKESFKDDALKIIDKKEISVINLDSSSDNECVKSESGKSSNFRIEHLNRALRPRKASVDYMGHKKKGISTNLKAKFKSKLDMLDPSLVNIRVLNANIEQPTAVIKLEKVDETMRTLRTHKNLEEFNKRIKEFQRKKNLPKSGNHSKKILRGGEILSRKSMPEEEMLRRKSFEKEEYRKSLHGGEVNLNRKSLQRDENPNKKHLPKDENTNKKNLQKEEDLNKKSVQREENRKSLQTEESQSKKNLHVEESNNEQNSNSNVTNNTNESVIRIASLHIKQEDLNKVLESNGYCEEQPVQEKSVEIDLTKELQAPKPVDRLPLCAVVKLEKDYTCNVDYPRIKIKRHLAVSKSPKKGESVLKVPVESKSVFENNVDRNSLTQKDGSVLPKNLRSNEKRLKLSNNKDKSGKFLKKKGKHLEHVNAKRANLEKGSPVLPQTDLTVKRYCEDCDTSFRNNELFKLHPCYQK